MRRRFAHSFSTVRSAAPNWPDSNGMWPSLEQTDNPTHHGALPITHTPFYSVMCRSRLSLVDRRFARSPNKGALRMKPTTVLLISRDPHIRRALEQVVPSHTTIFNVTDVASGIRELHRTGLALILCEG